MARTPFQARLRVELVPPPAAGAAPKGEVHLRSLPSARWRRRSPRAAAAMRDEFGWEATPLSQAVREYMAWLREGS